MNAAEKINVWRSGCQCSECCKAFVVAYCSGVIPEGTEYLAVDVDGEITAHYAEPWSEPDCHEGYEIEDENGDPVEVATIDGLTEAEGFALFRSGPYKI